MERIAAIDLGTNSVRLAVADIHDDHTIHLVRESKEVIRLGAGESEGRLAEDAIRRAETACRGFADLARGLGADPLLAVATSATREAVNRDDLLTRIRAGSGLDVHVISGQEEGRLVHLGVVHNESLPPGRVAVIDIGGGSVEIACGDRHGADTLESVKLGAIRTTIARPPDADGRYPADLLNGLRAYARNTSLRALQRVRDTDPAVIVGTSGTIETLQRMTHQGPEGDRPTLHLKRLTRLLHRLAKRTPAERMRIPGLNPERADIIVAGAAVLEQILLGLGRDGLLYSTRTLRDGLLLDYVLRDEEARRAYGMTPVRERSVLRMLRRFRGEEEHALAVAGLATSLFDQSRALGWHAYGDTERELLRFGAMLHDVGVIISPSGHHRHGHYIISTVSLPGFQKDEIDVMAALARFHRKSLPRPSHPGLAPLAPAHQAFVRDIVPLLRLADALDRSHKGAVPEARLEADGAGAAIVTALVPAPIPYEEWAVGRVLEATPDLFGRPIRFHVHPAPAE